MQALAAHSPCVRLQTYGRTVSKRSPRCNGHTVFIGQPGDAAHPVFVTWCPRGTIEATLDEMSGLHPGVTLIDYQSSDYAGYLMWAGQVRNSRKSGNWYKRTKKFNAAMPERTRNNG